MQSKKTREAANSVMFDSHLLSAFMQLKQMCVCVCVPALIWPHLCVMNQLPMIDYVCLSAIGIEAKQAKRFLDCLLVENIVRPVFGYIARGQSSITSKVKSSYLLQ